MANDSRTLTKLIALLYAISHLDASRAERPLEKVLAFAVDGSIGGTDERCEVHPPLSTRLFVLRFLLRSGGLQNSSDRALDVGRGISVDQP